MWLVPLAETGRKGRMTSEINKSTLDFATLAGLKSRFETRIYGTNGETFQPKSARTRSSSSFDIFNGEKAKKQRRNLQMIVKNFWREIIFRGGAGGVKLVGKCSK